VQEHGSQPRSLKGITWCGDVTAVVGSQELNSVNLTGSGGPGEPALGFVNFLKHAVEFKSFLSLPQTPSYPPVKWGSRAAARPQETAVNTACHTEMGNPRLFPSFHFLSDTPHPVFLVFSLFLFTLEMKHLFFLKMKHLKNFKTSPW
jgi:hypothetical protein